MDNKLEKSLLDKLHSSPLFRPERRRPVKRSSILELRSEIQKLQLEVQEIESRKELANDPTQSCESKQREENGCTASTDLCNDLQAMLEKGHFADVSIKCGSDVLRAHKNVLCARSPVFEAMFMSPMQENVADEVAIDDIEYSVFRTMLRFMYCGQLEDLTMPVACDLLYAAEKYQIKMLKEICLNYLKSNVSEDNVFEILQCGELYDKDLKTSALNFISEHFCALKGTDKWKTIQLQYPVLAVEVYSHVVDRRGLLPS